MVCTKVSRIKLARRLWRILIALLIFATLYSIFVWNPLLLFECETHSPTSLFSTWYKRIISFHGPRKRPKRPPFHELSRSVVSWQSRNPNVSNLQYHLNLLLQMISHLRNLFLWFQHLNHHFYLRQQPFPLQTPRDISFRLPILIPVSPSFTHISVPFCARYPISRTRKRCCYSPPASRINHTSR